MCPCCKELPSAVPISAWYTSSEVREITVSAVVHLDFERIQETCIQGSCVPADPELMPCVNVPNLMFFCCLIFMIMLNVVYVKIIFSVLKYERIDITKEFEAPCKSISEYKFSDFTC